MVMPLGCCACVANVASLCPVKKTQLRTTKNLQCNARAQHHTRLNAACVSHTYIVHVCTYVRKCACTVYVHIRTYRIAGNFRGALFSWLKGDPRNFNPRNINRL